MKRCFPALAVLVSLFVGVASADYVIIKIDLNKVKGQAQAGDPKKMGGPGPGGSRPDGPGSGVPGPGKGPGGPGPGGPGPGGPGPGGGYGPGSGYGPGGDYGTGGGYGGGKGKGRPGGGIPGGGIPGGGVPGGGIPGGGMPGGGFPGGGQFGQPAGPIDQEKGPPPNYVYAYLELKQPWKWHGADKNFRFGPHVHLAHPQYSNRIYLPGDPSFFDIVEIVLVAAPPVSKQFEMMYKAEFKDKEPRSPDKLLAFAQWALQRGLMAEFHKVMDELGKADSTHPIWVAYDKTKAALDPKKAPKVNDPAAREFLEELKKDGYRTVPNDKGHYVMLTNVKGGMQDAALAKKLSRLEDAYSSFFYWFALKGQVRALPPHRLAVVVVDSPNDRSKEFLDKRAMFNNQPMVGSGFTARRDNVIVVASGRVDAYYTALAEFNQGWLTNWNLNFTTVLTDPLSLEKSSPKVFPIVPLLQMLTLCQRAMEEDNEVATLSHEAMRQLASATNILPRNVSTAEWARFGMASFFETPAQSFYPCTGGPNWLHLVNWKVLRKDNKLQTKDAREILLNVVMDKDFRQAYGSEAQLLKDKNHQLLKLKVQEELERARTTSWSLMYYLMHKQPKALDRYFKELAKLPRDLDYDSKVLRECFYRAFDLLEQDPDNKDRKIVNLGKLDSLAGKWMKFVDDEIIHESNPQVEKEVATVRVFEYKQRQEAVAAAKAAQDNAATGPGGPGVGPGGPGDRPGGPGVGPGVPGPYGPGPGGPSKGKNYGTGGYDSRGGN
jgi:hypothetical protein